MTDRTKNIIVSCVFLPLAIAGLLGWVLIRSKNREDRAPRGLPEMGEPLTLEAAAQKATTGLPILKALFRCYQQWGVWPISLEEIGPEWLPDSQIGRWKYHWRIEYWVLEQHDWSSHSTIQYRWQKGRGQWSLTDGASVVPLTVHSSPESSPLPESSKQVEVNLDLFVRRIKETNGKLIHYQGLISRLYREKRYLLAHAFCLKALQRYPRHWWPCSMLGDIECESRLGSAAEAHLMRLLKARQDFPHAFLLARYYRRKGERDKWKATIQRGLSMKVDYLHSPERNTGERLAHSAPEFFWKAAAQAYAASEPELTLAICKRWREHATAKNRYIYPDYYLYPAAINLAQGKFDIARSLVEKAEKATKRRHSMKKDVAQFAAALSRRDVSFRWEPNPPVPPFSLVINYH